MVAWKKDKKRKNGHGHEGRGIIRYQRQYGAGRVAFDDDVLLPHSHDFGNFKAPVIIDDNYRSPAVDAWCDRAADYTYGADEPMDFNVKRLRNNLKYYVE